MAGDSAGRYAGLRGPPYARCGECCRTGGAPWSWRSRARGKELDSALQAEPGEYANIAAVTTTVDGSLVLGRAGAGLREPDRIRPAQGRGAQVVMSHEATHVATGATFTAMPTWLQEGFADFVALDGAGVPVELAARQILDRIRKEGLPQRLPTTADLDPSANGLGRRTRRRGWPAASWHRSTARTGWSGSTAR